MSFRKNRIGEEEIQAVTEVLKSGNLSPYFRNFRGGCKVQELEYLFAEYLGAKYAIAVSSGSTAIHTALLACGVKGGWEVLVPPYTFVASVSMIVAAGGRPRFVDVDPRTYNIDPEDMIEAITPKTKAVFPVHLLGHPADMEPIMEVAEDHGLKVIEDCAQSLGSRYRGKQVGTFGQAGVFSGQETKSCTFGGEGGMIVTDDPKVAERSRFLRNHGEKYAPQKGRMMGFNYRLSELHAAVGVEQLKKYPMFLEAQVRNARRLIQGLPDGIEPPYVSPEVEHTYLFVGCIYDAEETGVPRDRFLEEVTRRGLHQLQPGSMISGGYGELVYQLPYYRRWARPCPNAEALLGKTLWLDRHRFPSTEEEMDELNKKMKEILEATR